MHAVCIRAKHQQSTRQKRGKGRVVGQIEQDLTANWPSIESRCKSGFDDRRFALYKKREASDKPLGDL